MVRRSYASLEPAIGSASVIETAQQLSQLLTGTPLAGRTVEGRRLWPSEQRVFWVDIEYAEMMAAWSAARGLLESTGRWPVVGTEYAEARPPDLTSALTNPRSAPPAEIVAAGQQAATAIRERILETQGPLTVADHLTFQLNRMRVGDGIAPTREQVLSTLPARMPFDELDRWLMDWEERQLPTSGSEDGGHLSWFEPRGSDQIQLLFPPAPSSGTALLGVAYFGEQGWPGATPQNITAIVDAWAARYGAELVANWGTMLQFIVARPPQTLEQAWPLAVEQYLVGPDTFHGPGVTIRGHARALIDRPDWFLHARP